MASLKQSMLKKRFMKLLVNNKSKCSVIDLQVIKNTNKWDRLSTLKKMPSSVCHQKSHAEHSLTFDQSCPGKLISLWRFLFEKALCHQGNVGRWNSAV